ncbi:hypothetical protein PPYR_11132 [Photinus pyralis]|uniref:Ribosomal protein mS38 C-terminal domain-containing protein n=1 Tax=Photinus pyralis TaxID=7054 RepID=A0A1Y1LKW7_PHOPY|nr:uncharacterized protein LOC116176636 [Photinus pyralis]KAB0794293.1 hypothetical protein PPYR_11132 [Photinus pyralis]
MSAVFKLAKFCRNVGLVSNIAKRTLSTTQTSITRNPPPCTFHPLLQNDWVCPKPDPVKLPIRITPEIKSPHDILWIPPLTEPPTDREMIDPISINEERKEAVRLIVIRRKKMKKHKLKKLRKKLKYERAKVRQRRELKKEKEFQAILIAQCKEAEAFSAEKYVADKLKAYTEKPPVPFHLTDEYKELLRLKDLRLNVNFYKK